MWFGLVISGWCEIESTFYDANNSGGDCFPRYRFLPPVIDMMKRLAKNWETLKNEMEPGHHIEYFPIVSVLQELKKSEIT